MTIYRSTKMRDNIEGDMDFWYKYAQKFYNDVDIRELTRWEPGVVKSRIPEDWFKRFTKVYGLVAEGEENTHKLYKPAFLDHGNNYTNNDIFGLDNI